MNKMILLGGLVAALGFSAPIFAEDKTPEQMCEDYAVEENVPAEDKDAYIAECIASLSNDGEVAEEEAESSSEK